MACATCQTGYSEYFSGAPHLSSTNISLIACTNDLILRVSVLLVFAFAPVKTMMGPILSENLI